LLFFTLNFFSRSKTSSVRHTRLHSWC